jgi:hypothetical protein
LIKTYDTLCESCRSIAPLQLLFLEFFKLVGTFWSFAILKRLKQNRTWDGWRRRRAQRVARASGPRRPRGFCVFLRRKNIWVTPLWTRVPWFPPPHPSDPCAAPRAAVRTSRRPSRAMHHRAPRARGLACMHARTAGRVASLGHHAPRQVGHAHSRCSRRAQSMPLLCSERRGHHCRARAFSRQCSATPAAPTPYQSLPASHLHATTLLWGHQRRSIDPRRAPPLCAVEGSSSAFLPAGLRHPREQVGTLLGSDPPPSRGRPHIAGRRPPLRRQGHIVRIGLYPGSFQQTRDLWVNLKFKTRVSV